MENKNMRKLNVTVQCIAVYNSSIMVPCELTFEEAIKYAKEHIDEINLGELEYISDSDELDEENCDFDEEEDTDSDCRVLYETGIEEPEILGSGSTYSNVVYFPDEECAFEELIIHTTVTGYGHSILEPNVPTLYEEFTAIMELVKAGFPMSRIVVRVDPIIPTEKGLSVAYHTLTSFMEMGFQRYRVSVIDMYPHARSRFKKAGLPLPYGDSGFAPSQAQLSKVDDMLRQAKQFWEGLDNGKVLRIESCAEPGLTEPIACGCISDYDLNLLGFSEDAESNGAGYQRKGCMCYAGKTELLKHKTRCPHGCLYCYWKDIRG